MKKMKKVLAVLLATATVMTSAVPTFAATTTAETTQTTTTAAKTPKNGFKTVKGKKYYYKNGKKVTDKLAYKVGKKYYKISKKGIVTSINTAQYLAGKQMEKCGRNLLKAFKWSMNMPFYAAVKEPAKGKNAEEYYASFGFKNGKGNCFVQAATFCMMAKSIGKNVKYVEGTVPQGKSKKLGSHAWGTLKVGGKLYLYDPNHAGEAKNLKVGYKFTYGTKNTYHYLSKAGKEIYKVSK